jgi:hypothetical protein
MATLLRRLFIPVMIWWGCISGVSLASDSHISDFSEGINPSYWTVTTNQPLYQVDATQGDVRLSKPYDNNHSFQYVSLNFKQEVHGDFDVQVTYRNASITRVSGSPGNQVQLNAVFGGQLFCVVRSDEISGQNHHIWANPPGAWFGAATDNSSEGVMLISRRGTLVSGYIDGVLIYAQNYNSQPATFAFCLQNNGTADAVAVTFDDFLVTADEIVNYPGDINHDKCVNLFDVAQLASRWLDSPCQPANNYCNDADQNHSGIVDLLDLAILAEYWLSCF